MVYMLGFRLHVFTDFLNILSSKSMGTAMQGASLVEALPSSPRHTYYVSFQFEKHIFYYCLFEVMEGVMTLVYQVRTCLQFECCPVNCMVKVNKCLPISADQIAALHYLDAYCALPIN